MQQQQSEKVSNNTRSSNSRANSNEDANSSSKHLEAIKNLNVSSEYKLGKIVLNRNLETDDDQVEMGEVPALSHHFRSVPKTNLTKPLKKQEQSDYSSNTVGVT